MKRPSFQFYPADWRNDAPLRMCSLPARGLWWEMLCIMHGCDPYGHLMAAGRAILPEELGRIVGESAKDVRKWLAELERHAIFSRLEDGTIYSRRMVRDEIERAKWRDRQDRSRSKSEIVTGVVTPLVTPVSRRSSSSTSSSSSSSSSVQEQKEDTSLRSVALIDKDPTIDPPKPRKPKKTVADIIFPDWWPHEKWAAFAEMRRSTRSTLTPDAIALAVTRLTNFRAEGHDIIEILDQSIMNSYRGLFPVKHEGKTNGHRARSVSGQQTFVTAGASLISELFPELGQAESGNDNPPALEASRPLLSG